MEANFYKKETVEKNFVVCPLCHGTGFQEASDSSPLTSCNSLPLITNNGPRNKTELRSKNRSKTSNADATWLPSISQSDKDVNRNDLTLIIENFLDEPTAPQIPSEILKQSLQKLRQNDSEKNIEALKNLLLLSRSYPNLIEPSMAFVYRKLSSLLQNLKFQIVTSAAYLAGQFFESMHYEKKPEFDELATTLLQKIIHMNKNVRESVIKALDSMILNISPRHCVEVLTSAKGTGNKSAEARLAVSRLLDALIRSIEAENIIHAPALKNVRKKIFESLAVFLIDGHNDTRSIAKKMFKFFLAHDDFESSFYQDVDPQLMRKIEKDFLHLKYECKD